MCIYFRLWHWSTTIAFSSSSFSTPNLTVLWENLLWELEVVTTSCSELQSIFAAIFISCSSSNDETNYLKEVPRLNNLEIRDPTITLESNFKTYTNIDDIFFEKLVARRTPGYEFYWDTVWTQMRCCTWRLFLCTVEILILLKLGFVSSKIMSLSNTTPN